MWQYQTNTLISYYPEFIVTNVTICFCVLNPAGCRPNVEFIQDLTGDMENQCKTADKPELPDHPRVLTL